MTYAPITVLARRTLLDALEALTTQRDALVLAGAQAIYLYTGDADVPIDTRTKDSDLVLVPALLADDPRIEQSMANGGFRHDQTRQQPGEWSAGEDEPPVELLVPAALHAGGGRRGARIPPHSKYAARVVPGLEAAAVSSRLTDVPSLEPAVDARVITIRVASPAALLVAKAFKIGERHRENPGRLLDKDAHDIYRLLRAVPTADVASGLRTVLGSDLAAPVARQALAWLRELTGEPAALLPTMAGRAERLAGDPRAVADATWVLVQDVLDALTAE